MKIALKIQFTSDRVLFSDSLLIIKIGIYNFASDKNLKSPIPNLQSPKYKIYYILNKIYLFPNIYKNIYKKHYL